MAPKKVVFYIQPDNERVDVRRPDRVAQRSVFLHDEIEKAPEGIVILTAREPTTSVATIKWVVLELLEKGCLPLDDKPYDTRTLAQVCNVLVQFECDPHPFRELWRRTSPQLSSHSVDKSSRRSTSGALRCWRKRVFENDIPTIGQLAISALVLGEQEALETSLGIAVWALDDEYIRLDTTVPELADLNAMRLVERKAIFQELKEQHHKLYDDQRTELAIEIAQQIKNSNLGKLTDTWEKNCEAHPELGEFNPYQLIRRFEDAIKGRDTAPPAKAPRPPCGKYQPPDSKAPPIDPKELWHAVAQPFNNLVRRNSIGENGAKTIEKIFDDVETLVKRRQQELAQRLISEMASRISEWRSELQNPGSTNRRSPKGKVIARGGSVDLSQSMSCMSLTRPRNGIPNVDDRGEGSSRARERDLRPHPPQERPQSKYGQFAETQGPVPSGKGKQELQDSPQARKGSSSNHKTDKQNNSSNGANGFAEFKPYYDHPE